MKILVACEVSGKVRDAFIKRGHDALSCDTLPTDGQGPHYQGDVRDILYNGWDMIIAFPPCTDLCVSGARWFKEKRADGRQYRAIDFFIQIVCSWMPNISTGYKGNPRMKIAIENPIGIMSTLHRKPDQIIQPWQFGHGETKATCLWLRNLPKLQPTNIVEGRENRVHRMAPTADRAKKRSETYQGIADAMAEQWGI